MTDRINDKTGRAIEALLEKAVGENRNRLYEHEIYMILRLIGIRTPQSFFVEAETDIGEPLELPAAISGRCVCKLISPDMPHRSEYGGIRFLEPTWENLLSTFREFASIAEKSGAEFSGMLVAEYIDIEECVPRQILVSLKQDRSFGPIVTMGLGGLGTEIYRENLKEDRGLFVGSSRSASDSSRLEKNLSATMFYPIVAGRTRMSSEPLIETAEVHEIIDVFCSLAELFSRDSLFSKITIEELEINPLQIIGGGVIALDGLLTISKAKSSMIERDTSGINTLLRPRSVLVIGASAKRINMGRLILKNLAKSERIDKDKIFTLHRDQGVAEIDGFKTFSSIDDIGEKVDLVVFTLPASEESTALISEIISERKAGSMILISGGFSETSKGTRYSEIIKNALDESREGSDPPTVVNGPNCMGIVSGPGGYNTFFVPEYKLSFNGSRGKNSAFISQSGAFIVTMMSILKEINPSYMVTVGNQIDLTVTDYLIAIAEDPGIETFFLYLEGFKLLDGKRFLSAVESIIGKGKKVIAYKSGRTEEGAAAVASHTAAMAGDYFIFRRLVEETGVILADSLEEFEDYFRIFSLLSDREPGGNRVGIISDAGYECSTAADNLYGMRLADFSKDTLEKLKKDLPSDIVDAKNPVDTTPAIDTPHYGRCVEDIIEDPNTDCVVVSNVASTFTQENLPAGPGHDEDIENENSHPRTLIRIVNSTEKPVVVSLNEGDIYDPAARMMEENGLCVYRKIERAVRAMGKFISSSNTGC